MPGTVAPPRGAGLPATRELRAARVAGWSLVLVGCAHLLTVVAAAATDQDAATRQAFDVLRTVPVGIAGPERTLDQLFSGYSLMTGILAAATGCLVLLAGRLAVGAGVSLRPVLAFTLAVAAPSLVVAGVLLPTPPIVMLGVTVTACSVGLLRP